MGEQFDLFKYLNSSKKDVDTYRGDKSAGDKPGELQDREEASTETYLEKDIIFQKAGEINSLEEWEKLCLGCQRCELRHGAKGVVFGEGNPEAEIMFVGEGPGAREDELGRPFVGTAGELLDRILSSAELSREIVYIGNVIKCRPPSNRTPSKEEIETCYPLLEKQIQLINPAILVCLGSVAAKTLIKPNFAITKERGTWYKKDERMIMPTFHPAALLRDPTKKRPVWEDIKQVVKLNEEIS